MFMQKLGHKHYKLFLRDNKLLTGAIKRAATHGHLGTCSQKPITIQLQLQLFDQYACTD